MKRKAKVWVARDRYDGVGLGNYMLGLGRKPDMDVIGGFWNGDLEVCKLEMHRAGIRLKPGEGPCELKVELVKPKARKS